MELVQGIRSGSEKDHQELDGDKNILVQNVNQNGNVVGWAVWMMIF